MILPSRSSPGQQLRFPAPDRGVRRSARAVQRSTVAALHGGCRGAAVPGTGLGGVFEVARCSSGIRGPSRGCRVLPRCHSRSRSAVRWLCCSRRRFMAARASVESALLRRARGGVAIPLPLRAREYGVVSGDSRGGCGGRAVALLSSVAGLGSCARSYAGLYCNPRAKRPWRTSAVRGAAECH